MLRGKDWVYVTIIGYVVLVMLFFMYQDQKNFEKLYDVSNPAIRFCCNNISTCRDQFISENFNWSLIPLYNDPEGELELEQEFRILYGKPTCDMKLVGANKYEFDEYGSIVIGNKSYDSDIYCLEDISKKEIVSWKMYVCEDSFNLRQKIHFITVAISVILLTSTFIVYVIIRDLKTVHGKCVMFFIGSLTILYTFLPFVHMHHLFRVGSRFHLFGNLMVIVGSQSAYAWLVAMIFDIWITFRNIQLPPTDDFERLKYYNMYAFGNVFFILGAIIADLFRFEFFIILNSILFFGTHLAVWLMFISCGYKIFQLAKSTTLNDHKRFEDAKDRFWTYLKMYMIMITTWMIDIMALASYASHDSKIIADVLKLYTAAVLFVILVLKQSVREMIVKQYQSLHEVLI